MLRMKLEHEYLNGILLTRANDITYINVIDLKEGYITKVKNQIELILQNADKICEITHLMFSIPHLNQKNKSFISRIF